MATDIDSTTSLQALADSTGWIIDRTMVPEKVLGQAWLISKGRVVTLASTVANYAESAWALQIKFPHPEVAYTVRTVSLHPDFNKREARDYYLAQAAQQLPPPCMDNDIATLALDSDLSPPAPERVAELNRALAVPFEISPQDMSGNMRPGDVPAILQSVLSTGRTGLLTMIDTRNVPFARLSVRQTRIVKAQYQYLWNETAMCELLWQQPPGSFAFQPTEYRWPPDVPEIQTPTEQIMYEAQRRFDELPRLIEQLGGSDVRFYKATPLVDFSSINVGERWLAERLWQALDGYMPLGKVAERVGSDTYSAVKMIYDLAVMGLLTINQTPRFHGNGQVGPIIIPASEMDLETWEPVTAFYLDPASGAPVSLSGNFFGGAHVLSNKTLLHTVPVPPPVGAAIILKDGKLVGLHTGQFPLRNPNNPPPVPVQRMMWIGSLGDLGAKRVRTAEVMAAEAAAAAETAAQDQATSQRMLNLRARAVAEETAAAAAAAAAETQETGPLAKYSKMQIAGASAVVFAIGLLMMVGSLLAPHGSSQPAPTAVATDTTTQTATNTAPPPPPINPDFGDAAAAQQAKIIMGVNAPPETYKFQDSSKLTDPKPSFELVSDAKNMDITFIEWPNASPIANIDLVTRRTPIHGLTRTEERQNEFTGQTSHIVWAGGHYVASDDQHTVLTAVVGVWDAGHDGKSIVFVAKPLTGTGIPDLEYPANFCERLIAEGLKNKSAGTQKAPATADTGGAVATEKDLADYRAKIGSLVKENYKPPHFDLDTDTKVAMKVTISDKGELSEMAFAPPNPNEEFNKALQRALTLIQPMPAPPKTKTGSYALVIRAHANDITVEEQ